MDFASIAFGGFWRRLLALIIDSFIVGVPFWMIAILRGNFLDSLAWLQQAMLASDIAYYVYFEGMQGATLGKRAVGLALVKEDGTYPVGWQTALFRYFARTASFLILGIGVLMVAFSAKKQGLHDRLARTLVVASGSLEGIIMEREASSAPLAVGKMKGRRVVHAKAKRGK
ncbi:MAG TPA: RDD family protein [Candidatus Norongarragalinales archaeon]|nr:RDD family protein [Candidatus Norongarragalinales archaeon]